MKPQDDTQLVSHVEWLCGEAQRIGNIQSTADRQRQLLSLETQSLLDIQQLIQEGVSLYAEDEDGLSALDVALEGGLSPAIIRLLIPKNFVIADWVIESVDRYLDHWKDWGRADASLAHDLSMVPTYLDSNDQAIWDGVLGRLAAREEAVSLHEKTPIPTLRPLGARL